MVQWAPLLKSEGEGGVHRWTEAKSELLNKIYNANFAFIRARLNFLSKFGIWQVSKFVNLKIDYNKTSALCYRTV